MMPAVLNNFPEGWKDRCQRAAYDNLQLVVPSVADLLAAKAKRSDPRDLAHAQWAADLGLVASAEGA